MNDDLARCCCVLTEVKKIRIVRGGVQAGSTQHVGTYPG
jgi:hypothetical protein